jgi:xanthine dehydrogenase accessory factor
VRDILDTLERWAAEGRRVATATVVATERSAPRDPGAVLAVSETGEVAGSVTGGCVEPAVYEEARDVLTGGAPRLLTYGIADEDAFEVGLSCGGMVHIFVDLLDGTLLRELAAAVNAERPVGLAVTVEGPRIGAKHLTDATGATGLVGVEGERTFVLSFAPPPCMYVFGAVDHAAAVARVGRFLGYRVTVCDARARFVTHERFPDVDELVVDWPDRFLAGAPIDERAAIVVLTHDHKFDVPLLQVALRTKAGYVGAMGSRTTTEEREAKLRAAGVTDAELARLHAPIGLPIGARTPEEVAVAIGAELVAVVRRGTERAGPRELVAS